MGAMISGMSERDTPKANLETLPPEIIQIIAGQISLEDKTCLSLSSRRLMEKIGTMAWQSLHGTCRKNFLLKLAGDLPDHFYCVYCETLHPTTTIPLPVQMDSLPTPIETCSEQTSDRKRRCDTSLRHLFCVHGDGASYFNFEFCHLALAMKRHAYGAPHGISMQDLAHTEVFIRPNGFTTLASVEPRICTDSAGQPTLVLQIQNWAVIHRPDLAFEGILSMIKSIQICSHIDLSPGYHIEVAQKDLRSPPMFRCRHCQVDFQLCIWDSGFAEKTVVVTKWVDLGWGFDRIDPKWDKLVAQGYRGNPDAIGSGPNEACSLFIEAGGWLLRTTRRNTGFLHKQFYKREFCQRRQDDSCTSYVLDKGKLERFMEWDPMQWELMLCDDMQWDDD